MAAWIVYETSSRQDIVIVVTAAQQVLLTMPGGPGGCATGGTRPLIETSKTPACPRPRHLRPNLELRPREY